MRQITMIELKRGLLSGEIKEDSKYWQIEPFWYDKKTDRETALMERLDIVQIEAQMDLECGQ